VGLKRRFIVNDEQLEAARKFYDTPGWRQLFTSFRIITIRPSSTILAFDVQVPNFCGWSKPFRPMIDRDFRL